MSRLFTVSLTSPQQIRKFTRVMGKRAYGFGAYRTQSQSQMAFWDHCRPNINKIMTVGGSYIGCSLNLFFYFYTGKKIKISCCCDSRSYCIMTSRYSACSLLPLLLTGRGAAIIVNRPRGLKLKSEIKLWVFLAIVLLHAVRSAVTATAELIVNLFCKSPKFNSI